MIKLDSIPVVSTGFFLLIVPSTGCNNSTLSGDAYDDGDDFVDVEIDENMPEPSEESLEVLDEPPFDDFFHEDEEESDDLLTEEEECVPSCEGKECGDDGCGGNCGACPERAGCDIWGQCHACGEMVLILGGDFVMGKAGADPQYNTPVHVVTLSQFQIDVCEVSNAQWKVCVEAGACSVPYNIWSETRPDYYTNEVYDLYPVIQIDWTQASQYCQWEGKRLPTEAEWEKAARGGCELFDDPLSCDDSEDRRTYPWGENETTCELVNFTQYPIVCVGDTDITGSRNKGASPYGILNLADNVYEYVQDWNGGADYFENGGPPWIDPLGPDSGTEKVCKGGVWACDATCCDLTARVAVIMSHFNQGKGFRCASDSE